MLTIKHITSSGEEFIYPSTHVNYVPSSALNDPIAVNTLWIYPEDNPAQPLTGGTAYVMNQDGKTVAKYTIGNVAPDFSLQSRHKGVNLGSQNPMDS